MFGSHNDVHLGPDVETTAAAAANLSTSLDKLQTWTGSRPNVWVAPAYRSILDTSFEVVAAQGIKTAGEQNFGPFPHFTLSMTKPGTHYDLLQIPTSEWLPSSATSADDRARMELIPEEQMPDVVDFFYSFGGLINLYGHPYYGNDTKLESLLSRAQSKGDVWFTDAASIYNWWKQRDQVVMTPQITGPGPDGRFNATLNLSGAADPNTTVDIASPSGDPALFRDVRVTVDGKASNSWRLTASGLKVRVGTAHTVEVSWLPLPTYEETDPHLLYAGPWSPSSHQNVSSGSLKRTSTAGAALDIAFDGTRLQVDHLSQPLQRHRHGDRGRGTPFELDLYSTGYDFKATALELQGPSPRSAHGQDRVHGQGQGRRARRHG